jgi:hypothetical protein
MIQIPQPMMAEVIVKVVTACRWNLLLLTLDQTLGEKLVFLAFMKSTYITGEGNGLCQNINGTFHWVCQKKACVVKYKWPPFLTFGLLHHSVLKQMMAIPKTPA